MAVALHGKLRDSKRLIGVSCEKDRVVTGRCCLVSVICSAWRSLHWTTQKSRTFFLVFAHLRVPQTTPRQATTMQQNRGTRRCQATFTRTVIHRCFNMKMWKSHNHRVCAARQRMRASGTTQTDTKTALVKKSKVNMIIKWTVTTRIHMSCTTEYRTADACTTAKSNENIKMQIQVTIINILNQTRMIHMIARNFTAIRTVTNFRNCCSSEGNGNKTLLILGYS